MIRFHCLECGKLIQANDSAVGRAAKCPGCGAVVEIPQSSIPVQPRALRPAPQPPPFAPPPAPEIAAGATSESLSLDELLGTASSSAATNSSPSNNAVDATADADSSTGFARTVGKSGRKVGGKSASAPRRGKAAAASGAAPKEKIRNISIAAIVAGVLGLALFAIPYAGPIVGVLGIAAGGYALALASTRRNSPMALALVGTALSVVAAGFGGYRTFFAARSSTVAAKRATTSEEKSDSIAADNNSDANASTDFSKFAGAAVKAVATGAVADARNPMTLLAAAVRGAVADPAKRAERSAAIARVAKAPGPVTLRFQNSNRDSPAATVADGASTNADAAPGADAPAPSAAKVPIRWAAADQGEAQGNDDVRVSITKAVTGTVFFHIGPNPLLDGQQTDKTYLHISLKIQNNQPAGVINYKSWMSIPASATLTDDKGNAIALFDASKIFRPDEKVTLDFNHPTGNIETSQAMEDTLIFHLPPEGAEYIQLKLAGSAVGLPGDLYFQIPRSMIKPAETGNPLLPLVNP